jgi:hypothetical protein
LSLQNSRKGRPSPLFNWLEALDKDAQTQLRATHWLEYGQFIFSRYPHLRPGPGSRFDCERTAIQLWAKSESEIANHAKAAPCLDGLSEAQRTQLAALLIDTEEALEHYRIQKGKSQWARQLNKQAGSRTRMLSSKLLKARKALEDLFSYANDSKAGSLLDPPSHEAREMLGREYRIVAERALPVLVAPSSLPLEADVYKSLPSEYLTPSLDLAFQMVKLYWFFRHECDLTGHESEVRVARLRNAFWTKYGIAAVNYRPRYQRDASSGCNAVHVAVLRFRRR